MSAVGTRLAPIQKQLEAYEESWREDHKAALRCRDVEEVLAVGTMIFQLIQRLEQSWRDRVFRGTEEYTAEEEAAIQRYYRAWLPLSEKVLSELLLLERPFGSVEGADELRRCTEQVREILSAWSAPQLSAAVGLREMQLDEQGARELRTLLDRAGTPETPPTRPLRRFPVADTSFLC